MFFLPQNNSALPSCFCFPFPKTQELWPLGDNFGGYIDVLNVLVRQRSRQGAAATSWPEGRTQAIGGFLPPSLSWEGVALPDFGSCSKDTALKYKCGGRLSGLGMWLNPGEASVQTSKILVNGCMQRPTHLWLVQDKPCKEIPLRITPATYQCGEACILLWSLLALCIWGLVSDDTQEAPQVIHWQVVSCYIEVRNVFFPSLTNPLAWTSFPYSTLTFIIS